MIAARIRWLWRQWWERAGYPEIVLLNLLLLLPAVFRLGLLPVWQQLHETEAKIRDIRSTAPVLPTQTPVGRTAVSGAEDCLAALPRAADREAALDRLNRLAAEYRLHVNRQRFAPLVLARAPVDGLSIRLELSGDAYDLRRFLHAWLAAQPMASVRGLSLSRGAEGHDWLMDLDTVWYYQREADHAP